MAYRLFRLGMSERNILHQNDVQVTYVSALVRMTSAGCLYIEALADDESSAGPTSETQSTCVVQVQQLTNKLKKNCTCTVQ